jgi:hypothetical protein
LQAHLTPIVGFRHRNPAFHNLKQWLTSLLKKWMEAANSARSS